MKETWWIENGSNEVRADHSVSKSSSDGGLFPPQHSGLHGSVHLLKMTHLCSDVMMQKHPDEKETERIKKNRQVGEECTSFSSFLS